MNDPIVIVSAARTPMGTFQGGFASLTAANLGAVAIRAAVERAGIDANLVDEVLMGCVLPAGQGQAPARQAALQAGLPLSAGEIAFHLGFLVVAATIGCALTVRNFRRRLNK